MLVFNADSLVSNYWFILVYISSNSYRFFCSFNWFTNISKYPAS